MEEKTSDVYLLIALQVKLERECRDVIDEERGGGVSKNDVGYEPTPAWVQSE